MSEHDDSLPLSALQHLVVCPRQCALIHVDRQWRENVFTAEGRVVHERADHAPHEHRKHSHLLHSVHVASARLRVHGVIDVVEVVRQEYCPIEIKRSKVKRTPRYHEANAIQVCAQAIALEETLGVEVHTGGIFYHGSRKRISVAIDMALRAKTTDRCAELHALVRAKVLPPPSIGAHCTACSLRACCQPSVTPGATALDRHLVSLFEVD